MTAMNGTKKAHTLAMPWMPPSITRAVNAVRTAAVPQKGMEKAWWSCSAAAFPCVRLPIPEGGNAVKTGKGCTQPFAVQTAFQHEHGASAHIAVLVLHPVFDGE